MRRKENPSFTNDMFVPICFAIFSRFFAIFIFNFAILLCDIEAKQFINIVQPRKRINGNRIRFFIQEANIASNASPPRHTNVNHRPSICRSVFLVAPVRRGTHLSHLHTNNYAMKCMWIPLVGLRSLAQHWKKSHHNTLLVQVQRPSIEEFDWVMRKTATSRTGVFEITSNDRKLLAD